MRNTTTVILLAASLITVATAAEPSAGAKPKAIPEQARAILDQSQVAGGFIVHIGCGNGRLTAALCGNPRFIVHGLDTDAADVAVARQFIRSQKPDGKVSVDTFDGHRLPYAENLVNLLSLPAPPLFDALVAADRSLYLATQDGTVLRLRDSSK